MVSANMPALSMLAFYDACIFAEPVKMLHHADYKDDMLMTLYGMACMCHNME